MKKILITGGAGFLGAYFANRIKKDYEVHITYNSSEYHQDGIFSHKVNLLNQDELEKAFQKIKPEIVIHCAAKANVDWCEENSHEAFLVNQTSSKIIASLSKDFKSKLVYISTDQVYDGEKKFANELDPNLPVNVYGKSKLAGEIECLNTNQDALIIRTNFYGLGHKMSFFEWAFKALKSKSSMQLYNNVFYTPIFIEDLIDGVMCLIANQKSGIYNVVGTERVSKSQFVFLIAKVFNLSLENAVETSYQNGNKVPRPLEMSLDNKKFLHDINFKISTVEQALNKIKNTGLV